MVSSGDEWDLEAQMADTCNLPPSRRACIYLRALDPMLACGRQVNCAKSLRSRNVCFWTGFCERQVCFWPAGVK